MSLPQAEEQAILYGAVTLGIFGDLDDLRSKLLGVPELIAEVAASSANYEVAQRIMAEQS